MDYTELFDALDELERERQIPKDYMLQKIEAGLLSAMRKDIATPDGLAVLIDQNKKTIRLVTRHTVVEEPENGDQISLEEAKAISPKYGLGDVVETEIDTKNLGRISAQNAKQVIIQGIREYERDMVFNEYRDRQHEILNCIVARVDGRGAALSVEGKTEVYLVTGEQIPGEVLREGMRVKVYVVEVRNSTKGPQIMISRTHPGLVRRLFELEVPEIFDGTVEIRSIAREAGSRSKVAVWSNDPGVDPIGACIGAKGGRVANIVNELRGEKIDIVRWSEEPEKYIAAALSPAEVIKVMPIDDRSCRVVVPDDQLSLAIGKEGQNARLAAKLTGWKIDIKAESAPDAYDY